MSPQSATEQDTSPGSKAAPLAELQNHLADAFTESQLANAQWREASERAAQAVAAGDFDAARRQLAILTDSMRAQIACYGVIANSLLNEPVEGLAA